ncbi:MAG: cytochrome c [Gammaproteobacteria bacterium]|nr:cytochrome c [Pseudomonadales bacterium]MCP5346908.1 cytochrome c [Pseudomonadales bacterium]
MSKFIAVPAMLIGAITLATCTNAAAPGAADSNQTPALGSPVSESRLADFDLIIAADGTGLPAGSGTADLGETIYRSRCQACHGENAEGRGSAAALAGGSMQSEGPPLRTVGSYWPYATTVFDFIRRAMPADAPKSLSDEEVYQVTAYVLFLNGLVSRNQVLDRDSLPAIVMPNRGGFIDQSRIQ